MDWQIDRKWSCTDAICGGLRWGPVGCGTLGNEKTSQKCVFAVYGPAWGRHRLQLRPVLSRTGPIQAGSTQFRSFLPPFSSVSGLFRPEMHMKCRFKCNFKWKSKCKWTCKCTCSWPWKWKCTCEFKCSYSNKPKKKHQTDWKKQ